MASWRPPKPGRAVLDRQPREVRLPAATRRRGAAAGPGDLPDLRRLLAVANRRRLRRPHEQPPNTSRPPPWMTTSHGTTRRSSGEDVVAEVTKLKQQPAGTSCSTE